MKFILPKTEGLSNDVIRDEFFTRYYPELEKKDLWTIFGSFTRVKKSPFVCALFRVSQKNDKTIIKMQTGTTRSAALSDFIFLNYFLRGDFYKEMEDHLCKFLTTKYGIKSEDIKKTTWKDFWNRSIVKIPLLCVLTVILYGVIAIGVNMGIHDYIYANKVSPDYDSEYDDGEHYKGYKLNVVSGKGNTCKVMLTKPDKTKVQLQTVNEDKEDVWAEFFDDDFISVYSIYGSERSFYDYEGNSYSSLRTMLYEETVSKSPGCSTPELIISITLMLAIYCPIIFYIRRKKQKANEE